MARCFFVGMAALLGACSPGPGRAPDLPDAIAPPEAGPRDATSYDASPPPDAGFDKDATVAVTDTGPKMSFPFTGVFGILNSSDPLYAREVNGQLNLVVRDFPYVYLGTIANDGTVSATSPALLWQGCRVAKITGKFDRDQAQYVMVHQTCDAQGTPLTSTIMGGFANNFDPGASGIYELHIMVMSNPGNCYAGQNGALVRYAMNFLPGGAMAVFTAEDVIPSANWYQGQSGSDGSFSANAAGVGGAPTTAMSGSFMQTTANDPVHFSGMRDIYDLRKSCSFSVLLDGVRTVVP